LNNRLGTEIDYGVFNEFLGLISRNFNFQKEEEDSGKNWYIDEKNFLSCIKCDRGTSLGLKKMRLLKI